MKCKHIIFLIFHSSFSLPHFSLLELSSLNGWAATVTVTRITVSTGKVHSHPSHHQKGIVADGHANKIGPGCGPPAIDPRISPLPTKPICGIFVLKRLNKGHPESAREGT